MTDYKKQYEELADTINLGWKGYDHKKLLSQSSYRDGALYENLSNYEEIKKVLVGVSDYSHKELLIVAEECKDAYIKECNNNKQQLKQRDVMPKQRYFHKTEIYTSHYYVKADSLEEAWELLNDADPAFDTGGDSHTEEVHAKNVPQGWL